MIARERNDPVEVSGRLIKLAAKLKGDSLWDEESGDILMMIALYQQMERERDRCCDDYQREAKRAAEAEKQHNSAQQRIAELEGALREALAWLIALDGCSRLEALGAAQQECYRNCVLNIRAALTAPQGEERGT